MRWRPSPCLHGLEVAPIPAHPHVEREKAVDDVLVAVKQAIRPGFTRCHDLRPKSNDRLESPECIDPHAEVDDNEIGIGTEVDCLAQDFVTHLVALANEVEDA